MFYVELYLIQKKKYIKLKNINICDRLGGGGGGVPDLHKLAWITLRSFRKAYKHLLEAFQTLMLRGPLQVSDHSAKPALPLQEGWRNTSTTDGDSGSFFSGSFFVISLIIKRFVLES